MSESFRTGQMMKWMHVSQPHTTLEIELVAKEDDFKAVIPMDKALLDS